jgi:hypothetical protein
VSESEPAQCHCDWCLNCRFDCVWWAEAVEAVALSMTAVARPTPPPPQTEGQKQERQRQVQAAAGLWRLGVGWG